MTSFPTLPFIQFIHHIGLCSTLWVCQRHSSFWGFAFDAPVAWNALPKDSCMVYLLPFFSSSFKCHLLIEGFSESPHLKLQTPFPDFFSLLFFLHYLSHQHLSTLYILLILLVDCLCPPLESTFEENKLFYLFWSPMHPQVLQNCLL